MDRDYWQNLLARDEQLRGYDDGFKLLFCPWRVLETADTLFLSLNPGNDPSGEFMRVASDERGNSYLIKREAKHSPMADQYRRLCLLIGKDPEEVLAGAIMPFRTAKWDKPRDRQNISVVRPFWQNVLATGKIDRVFCMGREVEDEVVASTKAKLKRELPANWGNLKIRSYETESGIQIFGLLHFSTYKMLGRAECIPQLTELLDIMQFE
ncbi:hypothetical protein [Pseudooceanicola sp.]|uniref:hypothetical protein n=1 Tax=Pseudooceanicola sp. TaxID=1914328 RepID=UPI004059A859